MEPIRIIIYAEFSDFKKFLNDFIFKFYGNHMGRPIEYIGDEGAIILQHSFMGALIVYKVLIIDDDLDVVISVPENHDENSQIFIDKIVKAIRNKFRSGNFPLALGGLVSSDKYLKLMKERWEESEITQQAGAFLSTIVLLGSILESMLLYKINSNQVEARQSTVVPKTGKGKIKPFNEWTLAEMIAVTQERGWISQNAAGFSDAIREYRNFIHPWKHLEKKLEMPDEDTCDMSRKVIKMVFDNLIRSS